MGKIKPSQLKNEISIVRFTQKMMAMYRIPMTMADGE
jgi:hypothetical protein